MSDNRKPEPSGPGLREIQRIQDERLAASELARLQACEECLRKLVVALDRMTVSGQPAALSASVIVNRNEARQLLMRTTT